MSWSSPSGPVHSDTNIFEENDWEWRSPLLPVSLIEILLHEIVELLSSTDFACLEILLAILARLLPSTAGSQKRLSYLEDVFLGAQILSKDCCRDLVRILARSSSSDWEANCVEVIDTLARHDPSL